LVNSGLAGAGYNIVWLDAGWTRGATNRDGSGNLLPDARNFPSRMVDLTSYIHRLGLLAGIYTDIGQIGCSRAGGSYGFYGQDCNQFFNVWKFDAVKVDNCGTIPGYANLQAAFTAFGAALAANVSRPVIVNWCNHNPGAANDTWSYGHAIGGTSWRTNGDLDSGGWTQLLRNFAANLHQTANAPGSYNDPDYLQSQPRSGYNLTTVEWQSQFLLWVISAAPLILGADPTTFVSGTISYLTNPEVLAINQDSLCQQCALLSNGTLAGTRVYLKNLADGSKAVALLNTNATTEVPSFTNADVGISGSFAARDVVARSDLGSFTTYSAPVPSHGVHLLRLHP